MTAAESLVESVNRASPFGEFLQLAKPAVGGSLGERRIAPARELAKRERRVAETQCAEVAEGRRQILQQARLLQSTNRLHLGVRGAARADEVRVVRVCKPVRGCARGAHDRALL